MSRPRIRTIKPEMWQDEAFGTLSKDARLLFIGLITMADDEGRLRAMPFSIIGHVFPYDDVSVARVKKMLVELSNAALIATYEHGGVPYVQIPKWKKHQRINRPSPSILPAPQGFSAPTLTEVSVNDHGADTEDSQPRAGACVGADRIGSDQESPFGPPQAGGTRARDVKRFENEVQAYTVALGIEHEDGWHNVKGAIQAGAKTNDDVLAWIGQHRPDVLPIEVAA